MAEEIRRRRRRKIRELIKPEEPKQVLPVEESSAEDRTNESRRRRKRISAGSEPEEQKQRIPAEESLTSRELESEEEITRPVRKGIVVMRRDLDEISSELGEERNSALVESNYWDETHSWGSDEEEGSDEYWHFLGRYE